MCLESLPQFLNQFGPDYSFIFFEVLEVFKSAQQVVKHREKVGHSQVELNVGCEVVHQTTSEGNDFVVR